MKNLIYLSLIVIGLTSCSTFKSTKSTLSTSTEPYHALGIGAFDGDSPTIRVSDSTYHVRLYGIDAPERPSIYVTKRQPGSEQAQKMLQLLVKKESILVVPIYTDQFNRSVCKLFVNDTIDVSQFQLENGNAWFRQENKMSKVDAKAYKAFQDKAKGDKLGLWGLKGKKYTPTWWRKTYSGWKER